MLLSSRGRTPAPTATRQRLGSAGSSSTTNGNGANSVSYYDTSSYRTSSRPSSRQSSVERSLATDYNSPLMTSSLYGSSHRLNDLASGMSVRSRQSSPSRSLYDERVQPGTERWDQYRVTLPPYRRIPRG